VIAIQKGINKILLSAVVRLMNSNKANPLKNVYFGEEHMHTRNSFDAFTIGVNQTWGQADEYAKG
jgi:hypothetical protein